MKELVDSKVKLMNGKVKLLLTLLNFLTQITKSMKLKLSGTREDKMLPDLDLN
jgi:hypothetical protein